MKKHCLYIIFLTIILTPHCIFAKQNISRFALGETKNYKDYQNITVSEKGVSYISEENENKIFVYNGKKQNPYKDITLIKYGKDNIDYAYVGVEKNDYEIIHNGKRIKTTRNKIKHLFITDKYLAYVETINDKDNLFILNKSIAKYDEITDGIFFENGSYIIAVKEEGVYKVLENKKTIADSLTVPVIKENGGSLIIAVSPTSKYINDKKPSDAKQNGIYVYFIKNYIKDRLAYIDIFGKYKDVKDIFISDTGESFVFLAEDYASKNKTTVANGKKYNDIISIKNVVFSENGKRYLINAQKTKGYYVVGDNDQFGPYKDGIVDMKFSSDSRIWGYLGSDRMRTAIVVNGEGFRAYYYADNLRLSSNGKIWSLIASNNGNTFYVTKNRDDGKVYRKIYAMDMSDAGTIGYIAENTNSEAIVILNNEEADYKGDKENPFILITDNNQVWSSKEKGKSSIIINGERTMLYDKLLQIPIYDKKTKTLFWQASIGETAYMFSTVLK